MFKKVFLILTTIIIINNKHASAIVPTIDEPAVTYQTEQPADVAVQDFSDNNFEDIDPDINIPLPPEPETSSSFWFKMRLLKAYLLLQADLAKQHIIDHQRAYIIASTLVTLGLLTASSTAYLINHNNQKKPS